MPFVPSSKNASSDARSPFVVSDRSWRVRRISDDPQSLRAEAGDPLPDLALVTRPVSGGSWRGVNPVHFALLVAHFVVFIRKVSTS